MDAVNTGEVMLVSLQTDADRALTGMTLGPCLALRSQRGIGGRPFLTPHSLQRLDLLEEVADEDVDGGVLLGLPVSQHVLESFRGVFMIEDYPILLSTVRLTFKNTLRSMSESMSSTSSRSISMSSWTEKQL